MQFNKQSWVKNCIKRHTTVDTSCKHFGSDRKQWKITRNTGKNEMRHHGK